MQHSKTASTHNPEVDALVTQLGHICERLAVIGPAHTVTVPLALPMELAGLMVAQAQPHGGDLADVYVEFLLHGSYHGAVEHGQHDLARRIAAMIRRAATPDVWERFVAQHPQAAEAGGTQAPRRRGHGP